MAESRRWVSNVITSILLKKGWSSYVGVSLNEANIKFIWLSSLYNPFKHHHTSTLAIFTIFESLSRSRLFMSYLCDPFLMFIFIFVMINRMISWIQTHSFSFLFSRICPIIFAWIILKQQKFSLRVLLSICLTFTF